MNTVVTEPFNLFVDSSGNPVNGSLVIGLANLNPDTSPKSAYWDSALTIPAAQPITLSGGMPVRNGTPTPIFVNGDYSIIIRDLSSRIIYSSLSSPKYAALPAPLEASTGSSLVGHIGALSGMVARTVQSSLRDFVNALDFGVVFDGVTDVTAELQAAINSVSTAGGGTIFAPPGTAVISSPITMKANVTIQGAGSLSTYFKYTGATKACFITATDHYNNMGLRDLHIDLSSNTNAVAGVDAERGLTRSIFHNLRISLHQNNSHGFIIRGEDPANPGSANQGQFYNLFEACIFKGAEATQCTGYGLYLFGKSGAGMRVNNNTVIGGAFEGATAGIFIHGHGNSVFGAAIELSPIGVFFEGGNCFANSLIGVYFDSPVVAKPVTIDASALGNKVFTAINCVNLDDPTDVDSGPTAVQPFGIITGGVTYMDKVYAPNVPKAWVNFEVAGGVVAVKAQYNITSVVRNGAGDFTVTFDEDLPDAEILVQGSCRRSTGGGTLGAVVCAYNTAGALSATVCRIATVENLVTGAVVDPDRVMVSFMALDQ